MNIASTPPLSLYVHIPWCVKKCPYCDFNSHELKSKVDESRYVDRLLWDLEQEMPKVWGRQLSSIFIGGGTPSLFSAESMNRLLSGIRALLPFYADIEVTMEANPGTAEADKFSGFYEAGINRLSMGAQSFNDLHLRNLGRIHHKDEIYAAFEMARSAGFKNINLDLMYALPEQTLQQAMDDLKQAIQLNPEHLSWYQLTLEPNTAFYQAPPKLPEEDLMIDIAEAGLAFIEENGYGRYEVSAYSRDAESPSFHNMNYWLFGDYLGIGAGAHQKITRCDEQTITRSSKRRHPKDYLSDDKSIELSSKILKPDELPLEFMMNALRLKNGFEESLFYQYTGLLISHITPQINLGISKGLIERTENVIKPTETGYKFLNELLELFMPENFQNLASANKINIKQL